jgi:hypothetical protein
MFNSTARYVQFTLVVFAILPFTLLVSLILSENAAAVEVAYASDGQSNCECNDPSCPGCQAFFKACSYDTGYDCGDGIDYDSGGSYNTSSGTTASASPSGLGMGQQFGGGSNMFTVADSGVGYIDSAIVGTQVRFRFDAAYDFDEADRAEFFYSTWDTLGGKTPVNTIGPNDSVDAQFLKLYYEQAVTQRLSAFIETAVIFNVPSGNPGPLPSTAQSQTRQGFGDMIVGFKYNLVNRNDQLLTFQLKNYIPTGEDAKWLTAGHYSIEPAILYFNRLNNNWTLEAELRDWISIDGAQGGLPGPYAGNVLRYGAGLTYNWIDNCSFSLRPVAELVGWSVLQGQKFAFASEGAARNGPVDAAGDTIVNFKIGARIARRGGVGDFYMGYGTALTSEAWYQNILRVDYRIKF